MFVLNINKLPMLRNIDILVSEIEIENKTTTNGLSHR